MKPDGHTGLKKCFENFIVGDSNRFAVEVAKAVAFRSILVELYNPLFIYGDTGLGKTHLLHAIENAILAADPDAKVKYVTGEAFTNEIINAIMEQKVKDFQEEYLNLDCLLVDDIQFFEGKERTQEEFFHIINTLEENNRQIIVSSRCHPNMMDKLEERLRTRLVGGLAVDIQPPDLETRIAILRQKAEKDNIDVPDDVIQAIAERIESNVSMLEGALNWIVAYAKLMPCPVFNLETIAIALEAYNPKADVKFMK